MQIIGALKDKVNAAQTKEEMRAIISEAGIELTDDELEGVAGGIFDGGFKPINGIRPEPIYDGQTAEGSLSIESR